MSGQDSSASPADEQELDQEHDQDQDQDQDDNNEPPAKRQKRSRACQACRSMKIRCLPVEGQEACRACAKVNRACIMPGPARKRQKTVHKVAELEKKIDALTASLAAKNSGTTAPTPPTDSPATTTSSGKFQPPKPRVEKEYSYENLYDKEYPPLPHETNSRPVDFDVSSAADDYEDVITRGIIDDLLATNIYEHWKNDMCIYCPIIAFPDRVNVDWLRRKRPMTLLAIFVVAGALTVPDIQADLAVELARQIADRVMFLNEKSMDLVHAMLIYTTWYGKHKFAKDLGFMNYINVSIAISLDLGLGKRSRQQKISDPEDAEYRRTWMGCYFMAGSVSTVLRLPPLLKFSPYIEECLESLSNHPGALPSDKHLCCLVRLTRLTQDVGALFHMDDPASNIPITDSRTQYQLKLFERQLEDCMVDTRQVTFEPLWKQSEAVLSLYIHEIALHNEHNVDDFRPMYRQQGLNAPDITKDFLTNAHFEALTICVDAIQRAMEAFLSMETNMLRHLPVIHIVWTAYVVVAMIRLHGVLAVPDSKYGNIFLPKLNVMGNLDAVIQKLNSLGTSDAQIPILSFIPAFKKLKAWHVHRTVVLHQQQHKQQDPQTTSNNDDKQPMVLDDTFGQPYKSSSVPSCPSTEQSDRRASTNSNSTQPNNPIQQQTLQPPFQHQPPSFPNLPQAYQQHIQQQLPTPGSSSTLLDPNAPIDASTFDIQNWDFNIGELNNFETYLNDAGWMGYLM